MLLLLFLYRLVDSIAPNAISIVGGGRKTYYPIETPLVPFWCTRYNRCGKRISYPARCTSAGADDHLPCITCQCQLQRLQRRARQIGDDYYESPLSDIAEFSFRRPAILSSSAPFVIVIILVVVVLYLPLPLPPSREREGEICSSRQKQER